MRRLIASFVLSLDGYMEGPKGEFDWIIQDRESFSERAAFWKNADTLLYGRKTYEMAIALNPVSRSKSDPFAHMRHCVFSRTLHQVKEGYELMKGDLDTEVKKIKSGKGNNIVAFGGASLTTSLMEAKLIDELQLVWVPVVLGAGRPMLGLLSERKWFKLKETKSYASGLLSAKYEVQSKK
ncbi:MAG: dihydrofolate reductase family protein [Flavisolibacter sp.]